LEPAKLRDRFPKYAKLETLGISAICALRNHAHFLPAGNAAVTCMLIGIT